jgi:hypothetical protein
MMSPQIGGGLRFDGGISRSLVTGGGGTPPLMPSDRRTVWQPGVTYNAIPASGAGNTIPAITPRPGMVFEPTTIFTTLSPLGSGMDDTPQINAAIAAAPDNTVIQLAAGTFLINESTNNLIDIRRSNITLRGAGPGTGASGGNLANDASSVLVGGGSGTFVKKNDRIAKPNYGVLTVGNEANQWSANINLASNAMQGAYTCTLVSNPGIAVGEIVLIDHNTDNDPLVVDRGISVGAEFVGTISETF